MLNLKQQRTWITWPEASADADKPVRFLLSPLTASKRSALIDQAMASEGAGKKRTGKLDLAKYQGLVADECIHGWENVGDGATAMECTPETRRELMEIGPANAFIFATVEGLGIHLQKEVAAAGNG